MKVVDGVKYATFKKTCQALGLLEDDHLWDLVMADAQNEKLPRQMRELFIILFSEVGLSDPKALFEKYQQAMSEDYERNLLPPDNEDGALLRGMLLFDLKELLQALGKGDILNQIRTVSNAMKQRIALVRRQYRLFHECRELREEIS